MSWRPWGPGPWRCRIPNPASPPEVRLARPPAPGPRTRAWPWSRRGCEPLAQGVVVVVVDDLLEAQPQPVLVQQLRHDRVELFAVLLGPRMEVRLADVFGPVREHLVHAFADVPLEVDVLHEHLPDSRLDEPAEEV